MSRMAERIAYGIDMTKPGNTVPYIDLPKAVFRKLLDAEVIDVPASKKAQSKAPVVVSELSSDMHRATIMTRRIGRAPEQFRDGVSKDVISFFEGIHTWTDANEADPKISVDVWTGRLFDRTRLGIVMDVRWPNMSDQSMAALTTGVMRSIAKDIKYSRYDNDSPAKHGRLVDMLVYSQINRNQGVTLETNPVGSCSVDTDGMWYDSEESSFKLESHNIYTHEQQLIVIAGAIALAHAEELV